MHHKHFSVLKVKVSGNCKNVMKDIHLLTCRLFFAVKVVKTAVDVQVRGNILNVSVVYR